MQAQAQILLLIALISLGGCSGSKDTNNLVVTSGQTAKAGQKVTITGTVVLDTDFGMGYKYPLMVEKSSVTIAK